MTTRSTDPLRPSDTDTDPWAVPAEDDRDWSRIVAVIAVLGMLALVLIATGARRV